MSHVVTLLERPSIPVETLVDSDSYIETGTERILAHPMLAGWLRTHIDDELLFIGIRPQAQTPL